MPWSSWTRRLNSEASSGRNGGSPARRRLRTVFGVLVLLNAVSLVLVFRPPSRSLAERQQELDHLRARHEQVAQGVAQMRELQTKLQGAIQNGQEFSQKNFLVRRVAFSKMLQDLQELASENQMKPSGITYQLKDDPDQPGWVNVQVSMTLEGEYPDLVRFVNRLEQSELFWMIDSLNVSGSPTRGLRLDLKMGTYLIPA